MLARAREYAERKGVWELVDLRQGDLREPGIFERADWDLRTRTLALSVRGSEEATTFELHWLSAPEWHHLIEEAGFVVDDLYGWFDRRPYEGGEDQIWVCRRPR
jgi:hypothetical protein